MPSFFFKLFGMNGLVNDIPRNNNNKKKKPDL